MSADIAVYQVRVNARSRMIAQALLSGAKMAGMAATIEDTSDYTEPTAPVAAFYAYERESPRIFEEYKASGRKVVFVDLGYWGRHHGGRWNGYHKVAVGDRHPTAHLRNKAQKPDRFAKFGVPIRPWRSDGSHIIVAGMSGKSARSYGFGPEEWEARAVKKLRQLTDRPIVYRPKPSYAKEAREIVGAELSRAHPSVDLSRAYAVVTHHSNFAVDAILAGIPAFAWDGVSVPMASQDLEQIDSPYRPDGREQWAADIAYCQWSVPEMATGKMWNHLRNDGLIP